MPAAKPALKLFVGFKTRLVEGAAHPEVQVPDHYKDAAKAAAYVAERRAAFAAAALAMPYTATFAEVELVDPNARDEKAPERSKFGAPKFVWHPPEAGKLSVAVRVRNYLTKHYKAAWPDEPGRRPGVVFIGFNVRLFLKILGLECSLPAEGRPCPLGMWYDNPGVRDIGEAVCPREFEGLTLPYVLARRRPPDPEGGKYWDALTAGWNGPGENVGQDVRIAVELAAQLGIIS